MNKSEQIKAKNEKAYLILVPDTIKIDVKYRIQFEQDYPMHIMIPVIIETEQIIEISKETFKKWYNMVESSKNWTTLIATKIREAKMRQLAENDKKSKELKDLEDISKNIGPKK